MFLDHLGIPSVTFSFTGKYGVYHSMYDNFAWMDRFGDPQFLYHAVAARFYGLMAMRLAAAEVVPLRFGSYARALRLHLDELRRKTIRKLRGAEDASTAATPAAIKPDYGPVVAALQQLEVAGVALDAELDGLVQREDALAAARVSEALIRLERTFLSEDGLPDRSWFRHLLYAPGLTTGYAAWAFPELTEAVENADPVLFERGTSRVVAALEAATEQLRRATSLARRPLMDFELPEEARMLQDLVQKFVANELLPLEPTVLEREARGEQVRLTPEEIAPLHDKCREIGLWGLDVPPELGGEDIGTVAKICVSGELAKTIVPFVFPRTPRISTC